MKARVYRFLVGLLAGTFFLVAALPLNAGTITLNSALRAGDIITVDNDLQQFSQIRDGARIGGEVGFASVASERPLGGVAADSSGNIYFAGHYNLGNASIEMVGLGQTTSTTVLDATDLDGGSGVLRDVAVANDGTIYVMHDNNVLQKFTPNGPGYTKTTFTGYSSLSFSDLANGHLSLTADGAYLLTSARGGGIWAKDTSDGADNSKWNIPGIPAAVGTGNINLSGEMALDPIRGNKVLVGMGDEGLYEVDFDPDTGLFPTTNPTRLSNDANAQFVDGLGFDADGTLLFTVRTGNVLKDVSQTTLAGATTSPITIGSLTPVYTGSDMNVARDLAIAVPEPSTLLLAVLGLCALGLYRWRRQR